MTNTLVLKLMKAFITLSIRNQPQLLTFTFKNI